MNRTALFGRWVLASALASLEGCGDPEVCFPASTQVVCGAPTGTATVVGPPEFELASSAEMSLVSGCLITDGSCSLEPMFLFDAPSGVLGALWINVTLPLTQGPANYTLPSTGAASPRIDAQVYVSETAPQTASLAPLSGTIVVGSLGPEGFSASFELELELPDHRHFSVTSGTVALGGCHVEDVPARCVPANN